MTFKRAAEIAWEAKFGTASWGECESCGVGIQQGTVPHHVEPAGMGGKRVHDPKKLKFLCGTCHENAHKWRPQQD